jgi:UDP-glucose 4-epimerase
MKAMVTGGAGFIGSHLVDALLDRGDEVLVIDDLSTGRRENLDGALAKGAELLEADVTDPATISDAFESRRPELVFHLAAQIDVRRSLSDPVFDLGVNVGATLNLLEAARRTHPRRFILASTGGAIYGETDVIPTPETVEPAPMAPYGVSKAAAETYLSLYTRLHGLSTVSLRLANVYGPRQDPLGEGGVIAIYCHAAGNGSPVKVFGDGRQTRDFVFVGDVAAAFIAAGESDVGGQYNVGTGRETAVLDLVEHLELEHEFLPPRPGEVLRSCLDASAARGALSWSPEVPLDVGLERTMRG